MTESVGYPGPATATGLGNHKKNYSTWAKMRPVLLLMKRFWRQLLVFLLPIVLIPIPAAIGTKPARCAYVLLLMAVFWLVEVVPMAVVALIPSFLYPLLSIMEAEKVTMTYMKDVVMLFVGSLILAVAIEECNLHKRIALKVLSWVGAKPRWLMFGFMCISAFLSMWMSNTATTAMITPISETVILELYKRKHAEEKARKLQQLSPTLTKNVAASAVASETTAKEQSLSAAPTAGFPAPSEADTAKKPGSANHPVDHAAIKELSPDELRVAKGLVLCVAYAANIGGTATLTGTMPNVILKGQLDQRYGKETGVTYATFLAFAVPGMLVTLMLAFLWLQWVFIANFKLGWKSNRTVDKEAEREEELVVRHMMKAKYDDLGPMGFNEVSVAIIFVLLILSWLFQQPRFMKGWADLYPHDMIDDSTPAMLFAFFLFIWPTRLKPAKGADPKEPVKPLVTWKAMKSRFPWDVMLLLGGALALAEGVKESGLSEWFKNQLQVLNSVNPTGMVILIAFFVAAITEFASNGAIATIFLPVLASLAEASNVNPLYYMLAATIACSFAFMLPMATPPNAIAFGCGYLKVWDMIRAGAMLNLIGLVVLIINLHTVGYALFNVLEVPPWIHNANLLNVAKSNCTK